ncbi:MAG: hypothetical protein AAGD12_10205 [Pseudomonadota bacterium]
MEIIQKIARLQYREAWTECRITTGLLLTGLGLAFATVMLEQSPLVALIFWAPIGVFGLLVLLVVICSGEAAPAQPSTAPRSFGPPVARAPSAAALVGTASSVAAPTARPPSHVWLAPRVPTPSMPTASAPSVAPPVPNPPKPMPPVSVDTPVPYQIGGATAPSPAAAPAPASPPAAPVAAAAPVVEPEPAPEPAAEPAPEADIGVKPASMDAPRDGGPDDLKRIKGVGPKLETLLHTLGFYHFDQISAWTADEVAWVDENLEGFKGRVSRDEWVSQAKLLAAGGETDFSKKVDDGDVY